MVSSERVDRGEVIILEKSGDLGVGGSLHECAPKTKMRYQSLKAKPGVMITIWKANVL
jgi:hypothetical protein